jgi:transposase
MKKYIGCDSHQRYSVFVTMDEKGEAGVPIRVEHDKRELRKFVQTLPAGAAVAVEASGGWYWFVDALEEAGLEPHPANPLEAKKQMPGRNKTDKLDARGLATLLRVGTLPEVWIPPAGLRDLRGLMRTRLAMRRQASLLKNRIHAAIRRYGLRKDAFRDLFASKARAALCGVGDIPGATIHLEIGDVGRFPAGARLAAYAGLVPSVHSSGGKTHYGPTSKQSNHYLKWAFIEAANATVAHRDRYGEQYVGQLYQRLKERKCHGKAATAVARHLAESSWWILKKKQEYRAPHAGARSSSNNG